MEIAVTGGTGMLGRPVVAELARRGHAVRVLTRTAPQTLPAGATHRAVDLLTGTGLRDALAGAGAVVDAFHPRDSARKAAKGIGLADGSRRLLEAAAREGVAHHLVVSIVGIDRVPTAYYKVKLEQERLVARGAVPWSIVRATQFHELLDMGFALCARLGIAPRAGFPLQPVDPRLVAHVLADAIELGPRGRLQPVAGPQAAPLGELARTWARERGRRVLPVPLPLKGSVRRPLAAGALTTSEGISGGPGFAAWLRLAPAAAAGRAVARPAAEAAR